MKLLSNRKLFLYVRCIPSLHACLFVRPRVCVNPLFVFSEGTGMKALENRVPRRAVEFKKQETDPVGRAV
jgi:hypothetical protein